MNDNDNNFEALRRLLALKRHEIPPPGYFEDFSSSVIARIRAGEAAAPMPWFLRIFQIFEAKPAYPVALASSLCVLLLFGIVNIEQNPELAPTWPNVGFADANPTDTPLLAWATTNSPSNTRSTASDSRSVASDVKSLFDVQPNPKFQPVSFATGN